MRRRFICRRCATLIGVVMTFVLTAQADSGGEQVSKSDCDRSCLYGFVDRYLEALLRKEPDRLPWAKHVRFTENNVALKVGDGLWGTVTGLGDYRLKFADASAGQVGLFGVVTETTA